MTSGALSVHVLLLTGAPGVGKTTVIRRLARRLAGRRVAGFFTEEIRVRGTRRGFRAVTFDGEARDMARVERPGPPRVGKYGVDVAVIDELAVAALAPDPAIEVYLVDEIGKMECLSRRFVAAMRTLLDADTPIVATIALRAGGFVADVKRRRDVELWSVTRADRDALPERAAAWLAARGR